MTRLSLLACIASTLFMTGVIWFVHIVHYPLFDEVSEDSFATYHARHTRSTTFVVVGPMVVELLSSIVLVVSPTPGVAAWLAWVGLGLAVGSWGITFFLSVPAHGRLASGFDRRVHQRLVTTNRLRVLSWTAHSVVVLAMAATSPG